MTKRSRLIAAGVRNLNEFGYPSVDESNILTDYLFAKFFDSMLAEHRGDAQIVEELRAEIAKNLKGGAK